MDEFGESIFKVPHKMTNEWIDYAENVHARTPFKYPSNNNSLLTNNNSFLTTNMHHQPPQQFYNKMGIKPFNNNLNNNNSNALNQYSLMNKFQKPSRGESSCRRLRNFDFIGVKFGTNWTFGRERERGKKSHFINREKSPHNTTFPIVFRGPASLCVCVVNNFWPHRTKMFRKKMFSSSSFNKVEKFSTHEEREKNVKI